MNNILNNNIFLEKEDHIYRLNDDKDFQFTSVTTFVSKFFEEFDADFVARKLTSSHPKYKHMTVEELLDIMNTASSADPPEAPVIVIPVISNWKPLISALVE